MEASVPCFSESQAFRQPWLWGILWVLLVGWAIWATLQIGFGIQIGDRPVKDGALLFIGVPLLGLVWLFWRMRLQLHVEPKGVRVRFAPLTRWRHFAWEDITDMRLREYAAIAEYGGWGLRTNFKSRAMTVSGDLGLEITLQSGEQWLIGVLDAEGVQQGLVSCAPEDLWLD